MTRTHHTPDGHKHPKPKTFPNLHDGLSTAAACQHSRLYDRLRQRVTTARCTHRLATMPQRFPGIRPRLHAARVFARLDASAPTLTLPLLPHGLCPDVGFTTRLIPESAQGRDDYRRGPSSLPASASARH